MTLLIEQTGRKCIFPKEDRLTTSLVDNSTDSTSSVMEFTFSSELMDSDLVSSVGVLTLEDKVDNGDTITLVKIQLFFLKFGTSNWR